MDVSAFRDVFATRYMGAVGLVALIYDHTLTFADEVALIWHAPPSFAKYAFLLNRYMVPGALITIAVEMCGFDGNIFTDQRLLFSCAMMSVVSVGIANLLVLLRVVLLWDHKPMILWLMVLGFVVSFTAQISTMVLMLIDLAPGVVWSPVARMCITQKTSHIFTAVWASPMLFEVLVLVTTSMNALDRPRVAQLPIAKALRGDGIFFFLALTCLRIVNLIFAALNNSSMTMLVLYFTWAMTSTVLHRSLLHFRRAEVEGTDDPLLSPIRPSPFALLVGRELRPAAPEPQSEWELRGVWDKGTRDYHDYHYQKRISVV
ncbi:hypothetical protein B0H21DRAFT_731189 [Amylocystis lapponica]|nr:hypothetical protein B0H21DRAFT_731189 [Amylocystis lapponica]